MFTTGALVFQQLGRVVGDMISLYEWSTLWNGKGFDANKVCGLDSCMGAWVQAGLFAVVILGEFTSAKWDGGYVLKWVDAVAEASIKEQREKNGEVVKKDLEKGPVDVKVVEVLDEKKPLI
jgi:hypothetical protein